MSFLCLQGAPELREAWVRGTTSLSPQWVTVTGHAGHTALLPTQFCFITALCFSEPPFILYEGTDVRALQAHTGCRSGKRKKREFVFPSLPMEVQVFLLCYAIFFFMCFFKGVIFTSLDTDG